MSPGDGTFVDNPTLEIAQPWLTNQYANSQVLSGNWIWVPSSTVVNSLRAGYSRYHQIFASTDSRQNPANYSYNGSTYHFNTGQTNPLTSVSPTIDFPGRLPLQLGLELAQDRRAQHGYPVHRFRFHSEGQSRAEVRWGIPDQSQPQ